MAAYLCIPNPIPLAHAPSRLAPPNENSMNQPDEFYIGWEAKAAPGIGKTVRKAAVVVLTLALLAPVVLAVSQRMIGASVFEWGMHKKFSGILQARRSPH